MNNELEIKVSFKPKNSLDKDIVVKFDLESKFVSEGISEYINSWVNQNTVLISAQTGMGKNFFIEDTLIKLAMETDKTVLIVSNRIACNRQQKERICQLTSCESILEDYTPKGLDKIENFKNVRVVTYQKLDKLTDDLFELNKLKNYSIVVFDECHFFVSDAIFNNRTGKILESSLLTFRDSIKIFMTATPDEIFPVIIDKELKLPYKKLSTLQHISNPYESYFPPKKFLYYNFKRTYNYIQSHYFNEKQEVIKKIMNDKSNSKWLIFVTNKFDGEELMDQIGNDAVFITADSKNSKNADGKIYNEIVNEEKFSCRVLLSTSVLDNGVNIKDPLLKNIVLFTYDKCQFLQMIGRKRILNDEKVNLYICARKASNFNAKLTKVNNQIRAIYCYKYERKKFMSQYFNGTTNDFELVKSLFYFDELSKPHLNDLSETKLYNDKIFYNKIIDKLTSGVKETFILEQLSWMGLEETYDSSSWLSYVNTDDKKADFINFLEKHLNIPLSGESLEAFQKEFKNHIGIAYGKQVNDRKERNYKETKMRKFFKEQELNYDIKIAKDITTLVKI